MTPQTRNDTAPTTQLNKAGPSVSFCLIVTAFWVKMMIKCVSPNTSLDLHCDPGHQTRWAGYSAGQCCSGGVYTDTASGSRTIQCFAQLLMAAASSEGWAGQGCPVPPLQELTDPIYSSQPFPPFSPLPKPN